MIRNSSNTEHILSIKNIYLTASLLESSGNSRVLKNQNHKKIQIFKFV